MLRPRYQRVDLHRESEIKRIYYLHIALRTAKGRSHGRYAAANTIQGKHRGNLTMPRDEMQGARSTGAGIGIVQCRVGRCQGSERR